MEIYKTILTSTECINYSDFADEVINFLRSIFDKTNITYLTSDCFEVVLNHGNKLFVKYYKNYTYHRNLIITLTLWENNELNVTTLTIPIKPVLTEELKEEIEYFVQQYLEENIKQHE